MKTSKKWRKIRPIYRYFGGEHSCLDYSEKAALEMYLYETKGLGNLGINLFNKKQMNGYAVGKHWMDVTIKMWLEDLKNGLLCVVELYKEYPNWHWWLDKVVLKPLQKQLE